MRLFWSALLLLTSISANAQIIDPVFGIKGYLFTNVKEDSTVPPLDFALFPRETTKSHFVLPDGSTVFGIRIDADHIYGYTIEKGFAIGKLKPNGSLDSSFGMNGYFVFNQLLAQDIYSVQAEPDGKILVAAQKGLPTAPLIIRLQPWGDFDSTFGVNGQCLINQNWSNTRILRRPDGKYWIAAHYPTNNFQVVTTLLNNNGTVDPGYGTKFHTGTTATEYEMFITVDVNNYLSIHGARYLTNDTLIYTLRLQPNGVADPLHGTNGIFTYTNLPSKYLKKAQALANGKSLLAMNSDSSYLIRILPTGGLDTTYANKGIHTVQTIFGQAWLYDLFLRSDSVLLLSTYAQNTLKVVAINQDASFKATYGVWGSYSHPLNEYIQGNGTHTVLMGGPPTSPSNYSLSFSAVTPTGSTDNTIGTNGTASIRFTGMRETMGSVGKQSDGKIIVGGTLLPLEAYVPTKGAYLKRFLPDGTPDLTFGSNGLALSKDPGIQGIDDMMVLGDNTILGASGRYIRKFKANGVQDSGFASNGVFDLRTFYPTMDTNFVSIVRILVQPDGKILFTGYMISGNPKMIAGRLNPNGTLDAGFGSNGMFVLNAAGQQMIGSTLTLAPGGRIFIATRSAQLSTQPYMEVLRLKSNGTFDSSFGTNGMISYSEVSSNQKLKPTDLLVLPDNSFLVLLIRGNINTNGSFSSFYSGNVLRYFFNGTRDLNYGTGGMVSFNGCANRLHRRPDGKVMFAYLRSRDFSQNGAQVLGLSRLKVNGITDSTFGVNGHFLLERFSYMTSEKNTNPYEFHNYPVPAIAFPIDSANFLVGATSAFHRTDGILQKVGVVDNLPAQSFSLLDTLSSNTCNPIKLFWRTQNETATSQFLLERTSDGINYTTITTMNAGGNTNGFTTYNYSYPAPDSLMYTYRLLMTATDGTVIYSNTINRQLMAPTAPVISASGSTTLCTGATVNLQTIAGGNVQWYNNGVAITGATGQVYTASSAGNFYSQIVASGCNSAFSNIISVTTAASPLADGGPDVTICQGATVSIGTSPQTGNNYSWSPGTGIDQPNNPQPIVSPAATTSYTLTVVNQAGCVKKDTVVVTVIPIPATPAITISGSVLTSSAVTGNQWYKNGVAIPGATSQNYTASSFGSYTVKVTVNGCASTSSNALNYTPTAVTDPITGNFVTIAPNPVKNIMVVKTSQSFGQYRIRILDISGKLILSKETMRGTIEVDLSTYSAGTYFTIIENVRTGVTFQKLIVKE